MESLEDILVRSREEIKSTNTVDQLESVRVKYLGKKGIVSDKLRHIANIPSSERKEFGKAVNDVKAKISDNIEQKKRILEDASLSERLTKESIDITAPVREEQTGSIHPISYVIEELINIFVPLGFTIAEGPQIEDDFHNFTALNIPTDHPARQMQDTFYLVGDNKDEHPVLRTHTSPVQIRIMENSKPPFKVIAPGRVYRSDYDMTHTPMFHQIEGLYVDKDVNMGHLKGCIYTFLREFFGLDKLPLRFRPSFFPFTEPSAEVDIGCSRDTGEIKIGEGNDWLEILGCGMVHPNVLRNVGVNPDEYQGFAFGLGVERLAMLKYGAPDLRNFFDADLRWLKHFGFAAYDVPACLGGS